MLSAGCRGRLAGLLAGVVSSAHLATGRALGCRKNGDLLLMGRYITLPTIPSLLSLGNGEIAQGVKCAGLANTRTWV